MADDDFDHWDEAFAERDQAINQIVRTAAFNIQAGAQRRAPKDTGFLANSIYARTETDTTNHPMEPVRPDQTLFPEVPTPGHNEAMVAVGATYGIYPERGTVHQAAKPYLRPSVEAERGPFQSALKRVVGN